MAKIDKQLERLKLEYDFAKTAMFGFLVATISTWLGYNQLSGDAKGYVLMTLLIFVVPLVVSMLSLARHIAN